MLGQYNFSKLSPNAPEVTDPSLFVNWINKQLGRVALALPGPRTINAGALGAAKTFQPGLADLTSATLTQNTTITLDTAQVRAGTQGSIELTQNSTGGWAVTWVNVVGGQGVEPTANKRTLLQFMYNGTTWVGCVIATDY